VFRKLGIGLKTTSLLESIHTRIQARVQKVDPGPAPVCREREEVGRVDQGAVTEFQLGFDIN